MHLAKSLLSKRFRNDGKAKIPLNSDQQKILASLINDLAKGVIKLGSHSKCPLCNGTKGTIIGEKDRLGIPCLTVVCQNCGLVFNNSYLDRDGADYFYHNYWGKIQWKGNPEKNFIDRIKPRAYAWKRFAFVGLILGAHLRNLQTVFEVGCGDGCNLFPYYLAGKETKGCDLDDNFLIPGRRSGLDLRQGHIEVLKECHRKADLIIISHVFEHMLDLDKEIEDIKNIINPGGYVYVEVPGLLNWNRCHSQQLKEDGYESGNNLMMYLQFQHNYHFDLYHLTSFWTRHGFKLVRGDEWGRAVFRFPGVAKNSMSFEQATINEINYMDPSKIQKLSPQNILAYLLSVERDFKSLSGQAYRTLGYIRRKLGI